MWLARQMGFDFQVASPAGCAAGGGSACGASGPPVAAKNVKAARSWAWGECELEPADDACLSHAGDAVVFCGAHGAAPLSDGQLRLGIYLVVGFWLDKL